MKMIRVIKAKNINTNDKVQQLIDAALEGLLDDYSLLFDFLENMGLDVDSIDVFNEDDELDANKAGALVEKVIRQNPGKAADNLGQLGDIYYNGDDINKEVDINKIIKEISLDASSADEFLRRMGYENYDISNEKEITKLVKEAFKNNKNKALKVASDYIIEL